MAVKDITLESDYDLSISNGDFRVNDSDAQHIQLICDTWVGSWKQFPLVGVGIRNYKNSAGQSLALKRAIAIQLEADGFKKPDIKINPNDLLDLEINTERNA